MENSSMQDAVYSLLKRASVEISDQNSVDQTCLKCNIYQIKFDKYNVVEIIWKFIL